MGLSNWPDIYQMRLGWVRVDCGAKKTNWWTRLVHCIQGAEWVSWCCWIWIRTSQDTFEYLFKMRPQKHTCMNNLISGQVDKWYITEITYFAVWECWDHCHRQSTGSSPEQWFPGREKAYEIGSYLENQGKPVSTKTDEFPENFRTAFDLPPAPFSEKNIAIFSANPLRRH